MRERTHPGVVTSERIQSGHAPEPCEEKGEGREKRGVDKKGKRTKMVGL